LAATLGDQSRDLVEQVGAQAPFGRVAEMGAEEARGHQTETPGVAVILVNRDDRDDELAAT